MLHVKLPNIAFGGYELKITFLIKWNKLLKTWEYNDHS